MIIDKTLPESVRKAIFDLQADDEFQKRFGEDKKLDELEEQSFNLQDEVMSLQLIASGKVVIKGYEVYGLSPLSICLLWLCRNTALKDISKMTLDDMDEVLFLLNHNDVPLDVEALREASKGFREENEVSIEDAVTLVITSMKLAFLPLKQIYSSTETEIASEPVFDTNWMTGIIAAVTKITQMKPDDIMRTPLNVCYHYYLEWLKQNNVRNIDRVPDEEVLKQIDIRTCELIIDYLIEKKIIKKTSRNKYLKKISNGVIDAKRDNNENQL